jgi:hypothetical protein
VTWAVSFSGQSGRKPIVALSKPTDSPRDPTYVFGDREEFLKGGSQFDRLASDETEVIKMIFQGLK